MGLALGLLGVALALLPLGLTAVGYELSPKEGYGILIVAALFFVGAVIVFFWPWITQAWLWLRRDAELLALKEKIRTAEEEYKQLNAELKTLREEHEQVNAELEKAERKGEELRQEIEELRVRGPDEWNGVTKTPVIGKTFRHREVELDGYSYTNCRFIGVTFVYRGEKPFDLSHNAIEGGYNVHAPNPRLQAFLTILRALNYLNPEAEVHEDEPT